MKRMDPEQFWAKVDKSAGPDGCWPWTGTIIKKSGYGQVGFDYKTTPAHRYAYADAKGAIPAGLTVDHACHTRDLTCPGGLCEHRKCCNPAHLNLETRGGNTMLGRTITARNAAKTHCDNGHEFTEANTFFREGTKRGCRACARDTAKRQYWAKKAQRDGDVDGGQAGETPQAA